MLRQQSKINEQKDFDEIRMLKFDEVRYLRDSCGGVAYFPLDLFHECQTITQILRVGGVCWVGGCFNSEFGRELEEWKKEYAFQLSKVGQEIKGS